MSQAPGSTTIGPGTSSTTSGPQPTKYTNSLAQSLTIDEMRSLHSQATSDAESKKTELKLVLASRYRELVGSSDEVLDMQRDAKVLDELVTTIPGIVEQLIQCVQNKDQHQYQDAQTVDDESKQGDKSNDVPETVQTVKAVDQTVLDRLRLADAPRVIHSCLDTNDVHGAATALIDTFALVTKYTRKYPLANAMAQSLFVSLNNNGHDGNFSPSRDAALQTQIKMIYLHLQTIPLRTIQMSKQMLLQSSHSISDSFPGCGTTAKALSALHLLSVNIRQMPESQRANKLMDLYFDSKAKLIHGLLDQLTIATSHVNDSGGASSGNAGNDTNNSGSKAMTYYTEEATDAAEQTISEIVLILQYDVILYPYQIFISRKYRKNGNDSISIDATMNTLPQFDNKQLKSKMSNFLAAHLPLIRSKVKAILIGIAGTTASRLGHIRQSLYDKTDGVDCLAALSNGICSWDDAIQMIDVKVVTRALEGLTHTAAPTSTTTTASTTASASASNTSQRQFSLWGTLFSNTFSSLVHSILSTSFHSVHRQVVAALRASLANAPPFREILPHEAYRNTLHIATELDKALKKVSDDAHELLVHAEEREESERRLRQSLYVQTCEIMGRLLNELRRMLSKNSISARDDGEGGGRRNTSEEEAAKELIVGRLCFLLKFRLPSLPTLLDPNSSPAVIASKSGGKMGMITIIELQSAFELADVDDDGLITFEESMEAMEGAFSGTHFHGAEMVRDTMLLSSGSDAIDVKSSGAPRTLTLSELALLSARGLRHAVNGADSALGTIQRILDDIVDTCFSRWAQVALKPSLNTYKSGLEQYVDTASTVSDNEWKRLNLLGSTSEEDMLQKEIGDALGDTEKDAAQESLQIGSVSSFLVSYFICISTVLNQSISPSDSMQPCPSASYASAMGIESLSEDLTMVKLLRICLLRESLHSLATSLETIIMNNDESEESGDVGLKVKKCGASSLIQMLMDVSFVSTCYFKRNQFGLAPFKVKSPSAFEDDEDEEEEEEDYREKSENILQDIENHISLTLKECPDVSVDECLTVIEARHQAIFTSCGVFFTTLFGEDESKNYPRHMVEHLDAFSAISGVGDSVPLLLNPLVSSRRFMLLPIQAEQSVKELQLIKNLEKERSDKAETDKTSSAKAAAANAVSSSFGFFSSMLKKT